MVDLAVLTADRVEADAIGGGVMVSGTGMEQALLTGARMRDSLAPGTPVALSGVAYGLDPALRPGALVVGTELWATDGTPPRPLPAAALVAKDLRRLGLHVWTGPSVSSPRQLSDEEAARLAADGAIAWDTESAWVARQLPDHPVAAVRVIADRGEGRAMGALGSLFGIRTSLERWARRQPSARCAARQPTVVLRRRRTGDRNRRTGVGAFRAAGVRPPPDRP